MSIAAVQQALTAAIKWLGATFGKEIWAVTSRSLKHAWARLFETQNILILGDKECGKTSLLLLMTEGRPYLLRKGEKETPNPTTAAMIVNKAFTPEKGAWLKLKRDLPGDQALRESWLQAVKDVKPEGIVYMVDGRKKGKDFAKALQDIDSMVLSNYRESLGALRALHIFLNFTDHWGADPVARRAKEREAKDFVEKLLDESDILKYLPSLEIRSVHLCPHVKEWKEATQALHQFAIAVKGS